MDSLDDVGPRDREDVIITLQIMAVILEAFAAEVGLCQRMPLDHGSHGPVEQGDAAGKEFPQRGVGFVVWKRGLHDDQGLEWAAAPATAEE